MRHSRENHAVVFFGNYRRQLGQRWVSGLGPQVGIDTGAGHLYGFGQESLAWQTVELAVFRRSHP